MTPEFLKQYNVYDPNIFSVNCNHQIQIKKEKCDPLIVWWDNYFQNPFEVKEILNKLCYTYHKNLCGVGPIYRQYIWMGLGHIVYSIFRDILGLNLNIFNPAHASIHTKEMMNVYVRHRGPHVDAADATLENQGYVLIVYMSDDKIGTNYFVDPNLKFIKHNDELKNDDCIKLGRVVQSNPKKDIFEFSFTEPDSRSYEYTDTQQSFLPFPPQKKITPAGTIPGKFNRAVIYPASILHMVDMTHPSLLDNECPNFTRMYIMIQMHASPIKK